MSDRLHAAIDYAIDKHRGQTTRNGLPYITHPLWVMNKMQHHGEIAMCIAVLHDVIEDTDATYDNIRVAFGEFIASGVRILSRVEGEIYEDFILRIINSTHEFAGRTALQIKRHDLLHNMDLRRLPSLKESDFVRQNKYTKALFKIEDALDAS